MPVLRRIYIYKKRSTEGKRDFVYGQVFNVLMCANKNIGSNNNDNNSNNNVARMNTLDLCERSEGRPKK